MTVVEDVHGEDDWGGEWDLALYSMGVSSLGVFSDDVEVEVGLPWPSSTEENSDDPTEEEAGEQVRTITIRVRQDFEEGVYLWSGAVGMSEFILNRYRLHGGSGKRGRRNTALEIGAGLGLPSLALAACGWEVVSTDISPAADRLRETAARADNSATHESSGGSIHVQTYDWFHDSPSDLLEACSTGRFDVVIIAECLHKTEFHVPLLATLEQVGLRPLPGEETSTTIFYFSYQVK